jgi:hypothetical protein
MRFISWSITAVATFGVLVHSTENLLVFWLVRGLPPREIGESIGGVQSKVWICGEKWFLGVLLVQGLFSASNCSNSLWNEGEGGSKFCADTIFSSQNYDC